MARVVTTEKAPKPIGPYSQAIVAGGFVFVSGQLGIDPKSGELKEGIAAQTERALENLRSILEAAGSSLESVVKVTAFLAKPELFSKFNEVYAKYFPSDPPARSIAFGSLPKGALVEIDAIAIL
ncbi:MAG: Rid family detoxifying hydrolase [Candidatus Korarchaeota archaeon]|nr:Rid family detoxifying hydrolase [Candidatus Korarchaeota archaeon]